MNKKLMAVAVAGALGAPALALAQASTVQIYGRAMIEYGYVNQGTGKPNIDMLQNPGGAAIGLKGQEALGGGLAAWFQCESSADTRGDGGAIPNGAGFCTRNSALGLKGGFGSVYIGKWDTPMKRVFLRGEIGAEDTGLLGISDYLAGGSTGAVIGLAPAAATRVLWQRRQHDSINYDTPNFSGFQGHFAYSSSNATLATNAHTSGKPRIWSVAALYDNGPLSLGLAYERHNEFGVAGGSNDDHAWVLSGSYVFMGNVKVGGSYNKQDYDTGAGTSLQKKAWTLGVDWNLSGPHNLWANYTSAGDVSGNGAIAGVPLANGVFPAFGPDTGVRKWGVGYQHKFSKRTDGKLGYVKIDNDTNAAYNLMGLNNTGTVAASRAGLSQDAWVLLLRHNF